MNHPQDNTKVMAKPTGIKERTITTIEVFAKKFVIVPGGCWLWQGKPRSTGYGEFSGKLAHRTMWELVGNPVDFAMQLDHLCKVKICVNPKHLEQVTPRTNMLRSNSVSGINARKTHCPSGHEYVPENVYTNPRLGRRECKTCKRRTSMANYYKRAASAAEIEK